MSAAILTGDFRFFIWESVFLISSAGRRKRYARSFSNEWEKTAIPFEESLTEEQTIIFHKLCDLQSETAADEMRAAYKAGFKDGVTLMKEVQE